MKGAKIPKQFLELGRKPILAHTIQYFQNSPTIDSIVVVSIADEIDKVNQIKLLNGTISIMFVPLLLEEQPVSNPSTMVFSNLKRLETQKMTTLSLCTME